MRRVLTEDDVVEVLPILPSLSIEETVDFYGVFLGFDQIVHQDPDYLIIRREFCGRRLELHFWLTDDRMLCEASAVYLRGGGIDQLHAEFTARSTPDLSPLTLQPWNMEEFYVRDPHGNLLKFGRIPTACP